MRVIARIVFSILFISAIFSPLHAQNDATVFNVVKMDIAVDGRTIGKPEFIMQLGSTAVAEYAKVEGYSLKVNLNDTNSIDGKTRVVDYELYLPEQDRWVLNARPKIQTELNQSNQMTFLSRSGRNVDIKISVHDNFKPTAGATYGKNKCTAVKIAAWKADMSKPVSYAIKKASLQYGSTNKCCDVCRGFRCCSTGRVCCYDSYVCAGQGCCTEP